MTSISKHLSAGQVRGLEKVGDVLLPGFGDLASFSTSHCVRHADRVLDYMTAQDLGDLKMLLTLLGFAPRFCVALLMRLLELSPAVPTPLGSLLRFMRLGLRGLVMTLYYADPAVQQTIGYDARVYTADFTPYTTPSPSAGAPASGLSRPTLSP
ncbi:MAG: hypothetical protein HY075_06075 [Deltaproteobacteria bacterium]|nr:hypothetical protein [Deltaproteobacteria bacterium]